MVTWLGKNCKSKTNVNNTAFSLNELIFLEHLLCQSIMLSPEWDIKLKYIYNLHLPKTYNLVKETNTYINYSSTKQCYYRDSKNVTPLWGKDRNNCHKRYLGSILGK